MKIRITENQYGQLVEQSLKEKLALKALKKVVELSGLSWREVTSFAERLKNPTPEDFEFLSNLNKIQLKAAIRVVTYFADKDCGCDSLEQTLAPTLYPIPIIGKVTKYINSCYGRRWGRMHSGVDLDTTGLSNNQPLIATCAGTVVKANDDTGDCGGYIKLECNNDYAVGYCHLIVVNENLYGLKVPAGFPIGVSGGGKGDPGAGNSLGPHLHYITFKGNNKINPIHIIEGGETIPAGGDINKSENGKFCDPTQ